MVSPHWTATERLKLKENKLVVSVEQDSTGGKVTSSSAVHTQATTLCFPVSVRTVNSVCGHTVFSNTGL